MWPWWLILTFSDRLGHDEDVFLAKYPETRQSIAKLLKVLHKTTGWKQRKSENGSPGQRTEMNIEPLEHINLDINGDS